MLKEDFDFQLILRQGLAKHFSIELRRNSITRNFENLLNNVSGGVWCALALKCTTKLTKKNAYLIQSLPSATFSAKTNYLREKKTINAKSRATKLTLKKGHIQILLLVKLHLDLREIFSKAEEAAELHLNNNASFLTFQIVCFNIGRYLLLRRWAQ